MPTKEALREWQKKNREEKRPPPDPEQTKRELGWDLIPGNKVPENSK
jgi:hypothetical protein